MWKEQRFESALRLTRVAEGDPRRALHGHSYLLRLHLSAPLDAVLGWTVDYGEVKALFKPFYAQLDHHTVSDLPGIGEEGSAGIARWVRQELSPSLPQLDRVDVFEQPGCGVALAWGAERSPILPV
nr:6-carboxytetrahydropterin synthase [Alkalilimnicola sp. S0819]